MSDQTSKDPNAAPQERPPAVATGGATGPSAAADSGAGGAQGAKAAAAEEAPAMLPPPPPSFRAAGRFGGIEPTALAMLAVAGVVLVLAVIWLWRSPVPSSDAENRAAAAEEANRRVAALETAVGARLERLETALGERLAGLGAAAERVQGGLAALQRRLDALERQAQDQPPPAATPPPDLAPLEQRLARLEAAVRSLEARPAAEPTALVGLRQAVEQLSGRAERALERQEALTARLQAVEAEAARRDEQLARILSERLAAAERTAIERGTAAERVAAEARQAAEQRAAALERSLAERLAAAEQAIATRLAAQAEAQAQRLAAIEGRAARLAALDALRARLDAGQPLGPALRALGSEPPPDPLARFADAAPPTEAALRLSFERHARAAREASEARPPGGEVGVLDSALARLSGLVTVRRGETVVWGDAAAAELERSRRALEAGDLEAALAPLGRLPPAAQEAMRPWAEQARALVEARAALRRLAAPAAASAG
jgi:hypothetical protein